MKRFPFAAVLKRFAAALLCLCLHAPAFAGVARVPAVRTSAAAAFSFAGAAAAASQSIFSGNVSLKSSLSPALSSLHLPAGPKLRFGQVRPAEARNVGSVEEAAFAREDAATAKAKSKVLMLEALNAIGGGTDHAAKVEESLKGAAGREAPEILIRDLDFIFARSPGEIIAFLKENNVSVINISAAAGSFAAQGPSQWDPDRPAPAKDANGLDQEQRDGLKKRMKAIERWKAVLENPELDVNLVVAAPNHPSSDGSYVHPTDVASTLRQDGGIQYDHLAPFHSQPDTVFPSLSLDAPIAGRAEKIRDRVVVVGGTGFSKGGFGEAVGIFTSPRIGGQRGNSFAAPKIAGLLWRLREEFGLGAAEGMKTLLEKASRPYHYVRGGRKYEARKIPFTRFGILNRRLSDIAVHEVADKSEEKPRLLSWARVRYTWKKIINNALRQEGSAGNIARGVALGVFVAMTPTVGLQWLVILLISRPLRANMAAAMSVIWISNPLTLAPIYWLDYVIGRMFWPGAPETAEALAFLSDAASQGLVEGLKALLGVGFSIFATAMIGGLILGAALAVPLYFLTLHQAKRYRQRHAEDAKKKGL